MAGFDPDAYAAGAAFDPDAYAGSQAPVPKPPLGERIATGVRKFFDPTYPSPGAGIGDVAKQAVKGASFLVAPGATVPAMVGRGAVAGGLYGLGSSEGKTPEQMAADTAVGAAGGGVLGGALGLGGNLLSKLGPWAEAAAVRSTNADRTAFRRAFKGSDEARGTLGRFLLDSEIPLRSPQAIKGAAEKIQDVTGPMIGKLTEAADATGQTVDLAAAVQAAKSSRAVARLARNTKSRAAFTEISEMLDDQLAQHGNQVPPSVAHDIRMQLDELANWDQAAPKAVQRGWRAARSAVDQHLDDAMQRTGLSGDWTEAQAAFSKARKLSNPETHRGLADIGAERRAANRFVSPYEAVAGITGGAAAAMHHPAGLAVPAATWVLNRYGMPATARTLDVMSKVPWAQASGAAPVLESAAAAAAPQSLAEVLADALRNRLRLSAAVGGETDQR